MEFGSWVLGPTVLTSVVPLAQKFRSLIKDNAEVYYGEKVPAYSPWLASKYSRDLVRDISIHPPHIEQGELITDLVVLSTLSKAFMRADTHGVANIVPQDIGVTIYTDGHMDLAKWNNLIHEARKLLSETVPWMEQLYGEIVDCIVPIEHRKNGVPTKRGFSTPLCYGAFFFTFEDRLSDKDGARVEMVIDLAHELGHHILHTYQTADSILLPEYLEVPVYSSVRMVNRPAIMSLHASMAMTYMFEVAFALLQSSKITTAEEKFIREFIETYFIKQKITLHEIGQKCEFTELGRHIYEEMKDQIEALEKPYQDLKS